MGGGGLCTCSGAEGRDLAVNSLCPLKQLCHSLPVKGVWSCARLRVGDSPGALSHSRVAGY